MISQDYKFLLSSKNYFTVIVVVQSEHGIILRWGLHDLCTCQDVHAHKKNTEKEEKTAAH